MDYKPAFKIYKLLNILVVLVLGLMALGAGVRAMDAGLACPDWPLCFGKVVPHFSVRIYFEFIHRVYAGVVALLFLAVVVMILRGAQIQHDVNAEILRGLRIRALLASLVLILQIVMGGLTVLRLLEIPIVMGHLLLASLFIALIYSMRTSLKSQLHLDHSRGWNQSTRSLLPKVLFRLMPILVFCQLALGGLVASSYSGLVCLDFPTCNGKWWMSPEWSFVQSPMTWQLLHRWGAYTVFTFGMILFGITRRFEKTHPLRRAGSILVLLLFAQLTIGIFNLLLYLPAWLTVMHQSVAVLIWLTSLHLLFNFQRR